MTYDLNVNFSMAQPWHDIYGSNGLNHGIENEFPYFAETKYTF